MTKWVYNFGKLGTDGDSSMRNLLGGKGANLAEMSGIGLPVPPGFTISTDVCTHFYDHDRSYPEALDAEVRAAIAKIETETSSLFADPKNPESFIKLADEMGIKTIEKQLKLDDILKADECF